MSMLGFCQPLDPQDRKARAIRFSTLDAICDALACQPGDLLRFEREHAERQRAGTASKRAASR
jgi:putative transcriptional regulator